MNEPALSILLIVAIVLGTSMMLVDLIVYRAYRRALNRHYARFPMFAVRDDLVQLVTSGRMTEMDVGWRHTYRAVNALLNMHRKFDVVAVFRSFTRYQLAMRSNPKLREASERIDQVLDEDARRVPEFMEIRQRLEFAYWTLIVERSWPLASLRLQLAGHFIILRMLARFAFHRFGWKITKTVSFAGSKQLPGWGEWIRDSDECAAASAA